MNEASTEKITAPKLLVFIGMLSTLALGFSYFYNASADPLFILWGIICLVIAFLIFVSLEFIDFGPVKIPYQWWIILIFGVVLLLFAYFFIGNYLPASGSIVYDSNNTLVDNDIKEGDVFEWHIDRFVNINKMI